MNGKSTEILAVITTAAGVLFGIVWPFLHEDRSVSASADFEAHVLSLTGVAASGNWTESEVHGGNYWLKDFSPAQPVLRAGQKVLLRLKSADVVHTFYAPALGIGPVEVHPGYVEEVSFVPTVPGIYDYYCTTFCGDPHFGMRGAIIVVAQDGHPPTVEPILDARDYWLKPPPLGGARPIERGRWLFQRMGCVSCHGPDGRGGVRNWNYAKETVPALNTMAEKMMLEYEEDAEIIVELLETGEDLESLVENPPIPRYRVVLAQYKSVRDVIRNGNPAAKKDPNGPSPPLEMPSWGQRITIEEINAIIAYLLTLQPWEYEG